MLKYNVRDTKKYYSDVNNNALNGVEIITYNNSNKKMDETNRVSHLKTSYVDFLFDRLIFNPIIESGEELGGYTISFREIDMYGEGATKEEAIQNVLDSVIEYINIYDEQIEIFSKVESIEKHMYMCKLIRCENDIEMLRKVLRLDICQ
jgi:hypothetical protein